MIGCVVVGVDIQAGPVASTLAKYIELDTDTQELGVAIFAGTVAISTAYTSGYFYRKHLDSKNNGLNNLHEDFDLHVESEYVYEDYFMYDEDEIDLDDFHLRMLTEAINPQSHTLTKPLRLNIPINKILSESDALNDFDNLCHEYYTLEPSCALDKEQQLKFYDKKLEIAVREGDIEFMLYYLDKIENMQICQSYHDVPDLETIPGM